MGLIPFVGRYTESVASNQDRIRSGRSLGQGLAGEILDKVRSGEIKPGDRLPTERELMATFDLGRNTVREAIQSLVALGVVDVRPGRGARVRQLSGGAAIDALTQGALLEEQTVKDLFRLRTLLEGEMASLAADRATEDDLVTIERAQQVHEQVLELSLSTFDADMAFHRAIAIASRLEIYKRMYDALSDLLEQSRRMMDVISTTSEPAIEHRQIAAAIRSRDRDAARQAVHHHFQSAIRRLGEARAQGLIPPEHKVLTLLEPLVPQQSIGSSASERHSTSNSRE
jgi:GntR family transcriptional regulator, transcriptional repressor for pyruvate dehydrogenase complex